MSNEEIFARIERDVTDMFGKRDITIWMTNDLFNQLLPKQFLIHKDCAIITLFGCRVRVVIASGSGMRWIVGYEGAAEETE